MAAIKEAPGKIMLTQGYGKDKKEIKQEKVTTVIRTIGVRVCLQGKMNTDSSSGYNKVGNDLESQKRVNSIDSTQCNPTNEFSLATSSIQWEQLYFQDSNVGDCKQPNP